MTETEDNKLTEVISVKFKNRGKCYFFDPNGLQINSGEKVIVETSKGLEIADCSRGNHAVSDTAVVQPLRPVVRKATEDDIRVSELNKQREKEAFEICQKKIEEHGLDMKLVDVECNFEGNKTMFFFTSDGRVDFRELVKDLAGIFRNRIELRQIGVRDEAKMLGGIGICGRPYCCNQFLEDFQPVSTKMAKVQSLSLNPTKISGSCGRLMCCLRYEEDAYEELIKKVPKQGAFVETKDGYGNVVQVNLLRQTVKVKLDEDSDDTVRTFKANQLAAVPGGRPKEGEPLPKVLNYVPDEEETEEIENEWDIPVVETEEQKPAEKKTEEKKKSSGNRRKPHSRSRSAAGEAKNAQQHAERSEKPAQKNKQHAEGETKPTQKNKAHAIGEDRPSPKNKAQTGSADKSAGGSAQARSGHGGQKKQSGNHGKTTVKPVKVEAKPHTQGEAAAPATAAPKHGTNYHRRYYHGKPKAKQVNTAKSPENNAK